MGSSARGPDVGVTHLGLVHRLVTPERGEQLLSVALTAQPPSPAQVDRAVREALRRMTTLNEAAAVSEQGHRAWPVLGEERDFRVVVLDDGQWFAAALTGRDFVTVSGRRWPAHGLRLVEVDPVLYLDAPSVEPGAPD